MRPTFPPPDTPQPPLFFAILLRLAHRPREVIFLWNWKSALLSVVLRAPIFLVASLRLGFHAVVAALVTESVFCAATAGFYGAIAQSFRMAQPQWLTLVFLTLILPAIFQALEYLLHWTQGTPHLRVAELVSIGVSGLSALFNLYVMRRNALLVGREAASLKSDILRLPRLIFGFITALPSRWMGRGKTGQSRCAV